MKNLKNIFIYSFIISLLSCEILDVEPPYDRVLAENAISDKRGLDAAINGVYDGMQSGAIVLDYLVISDLAADNLEAVGSKIDYITINNNDPFSTNIYVEAVWNAHYDVINRANNILDNIGSVDGVSEAEANRGEAEMRTIRAICYFNLVRMFGGVPLRESAINGASEEDIFIGRASEADTYQFIQDDLEISEDLLEGAGRGNSVRVDEPTVKALLARLHLYQENWANAEAYAKSVIDGFGYELVEDYTSIFDEANSSNEIIFQIDFLNDDDVNTIARWLLAAGRYEAAATEDVYDLYESQDLRASASVGDAGGDFFCNKYTGLQNDVDNLIVTRLSEMYLIAAEAINEQAYDANSDAFDFLNEVRERAGLNEITNLEATDQASLREAIALERRKELAFEGHRWHDLVRTHQAQAVLEISNPNKLLFPIPQSEIDTNKHPEMVQNEDY
ncbi:RagB/SusD family nutrient uptake outer membrane protein [Marivirga harenae]|uniref:RagB/SusD family nutrient uptake outer membrane protein n=1 Tax=Marivirga harenae TaxID=2010992 RepID=UPI0026DFF0DE|nr:RagB/SusD family nutrient uptake outer membrane protein [Marivirga harenae]WKV13841.1 RagB/SusD family nutrient uptake outer membrane protein [Marivirga harenae]